MGMHMRAALALILCFVARGSPTRDEACPVYQESGAAAGTPFATGSSEVVHKPSSSRPQMLLEAIHRFWFPMLRVMLIHALEAR